tara:strand:- start:50 stop:1042 length:993 start_codon:yes stop_codon:yes gene_type:complete
VGKLEQRAINTHAKRIELVEKYTELLRIFKIMERYYEQGHTQMKLRRDKIPRSALGSKRLYNKLPNLSEKTNEEIQKIIGAQRKKVIEGALRGHNPEFKKKTKSLILLKEKQGKLYEENIKELRNMRRNLLKQHENKPIQTIIEAEKLINKEIETTIEPLKRALQKFQKVTQKHTEQKEEMKKKEETAKVARDVAKEAKKKEKEQFKGGIKLVKLFRAKQRKLMAENIKARKRSKEKKDKEYERNAREKAKQAEQQRKQLKRLETEAKQAIEEVAKEARRREREQKKAEKAEKDAEKETRRLEREQKKAEKEVRDAKRLVEQVLEKASIK